MQNPKGSRVSVCWSDGGKSYEGLVTKKKRCRNHFFVEFGDGDKGWIDFHETKVWLLSTSPDYDLAEIEQKENTKETNMQQEARKSGIVHSASDIRKGSRASVSWSDS